MKFEKLQPGTIAYTVSRHKMGNTTVSTIAIHSVHVFEVDTERRTVKASWNSNPAKTFYESQTKKWKEKKPVTITSLMGQKRLARRDEIKAMKERGEI
jgi:hypothetical protein